MARGWESKAIEAQQDEARRETRRRPALGPEVAARLERRRTLELARARAVDDLERATVASHREMLRRAIDALDGQLAALGDERA